MGLLCLMNMTITTEAYHPRAINLAKSYWEIDKNLLILTTSKCDFDKKYTLDFKNTKARFISKSPRDKSNRDIKTSIQFYESEFF